MTTEKLSYGIRSFVADQIKLESWLKEHGKWLIKLKVFSQKTC
jgi:hypothetical protein